MYTTAQKLIYKLTKINQQKILWYKLSFVAVLSIAFIIIDYDFIVEKKLERYFLFAGLIVSAIWWYWTMNVLSTLLKIKNLQLEMLEDILENIKQVKINVKDS